MHLDIGSYWHAISWDRSPYEKRMRSLSELTNPVPTMLTYVLPDAGPLFGVTW